MSILFLIIIYIVGGALLTAWMSNWELKYRPKNPHDPMPVKGMIGAIGLIFCSFAWALILVFTAGHVILWLSKLL